MGVCENQRPNKADKGQILVIAALSLVALLGFAALAIDVAYWYHTRNQLQGAADAAALAGAALVSCENDTGGSAILLQADARQSAWKYACKNKAAQQSVYLVTNNAQNCDTPPDAAALNASNGVNEDIVVGHWTGTDFIAATGSTNNRINAVKVRDRMTGETPGMPKVTTFFGRIFGLNEVNVGTTAVAQGCLTLSPISVNEYWMGNSPLSGSQDCKEPVFSDPARTPYGANHVYPNSFARPPCTIPGASNCTTPVNGNVFANYTFTDFKTRDCNGNAITPEVTENGPLPANCSGSEECKGRPPGMFRAGRVFAIVGGGAYPNKGSNMHSLLYLDERISSSKDTGGSQQWYAVFGDTFTPNSPNKSNADSHKSDVAGHIASGNYPNKLPTSVVEVFQPGYKDVNLYTSVEPYASISFISGQGVVGQMVKANFYDDASYSGGRYAPGEKIIVTVYDGIVGGSGNQERTTIVGFAKITIFGYGKNLNLDSNGLPLVAPPSGNPNEMTMYGYIETAEDFKPTFEELETVRTPSRLVK